MRSKDDVIKIDTRWIILVGAIIDLNFSNFEERVKIYEEG